MGNHSIYDTHNIHSTQRKKVYTRDGTNHDTTDIHSRKRDHKKDHSPNRTSGDGAIGSDSIHRDHNGRGSYYYLNIFDKGYRFLYPGHIAYEPLAG